MEAWLSIYAENQLISSIQQPERYDSSISNDSWHVFPHWSHSDTLLHAASLPASPATECKTANQDGIPAANCPMPSMRLHHKPTANLQQDLSFKQDEFSDLDGPILWISDLFDPIWVYERQVMLADCKSLLSDILVQTTLSRTIKDSDILIHHAGYMLSRCEYRRFMNETAETIAILSYEKNS